MELQEMMENLYEMKSEYRRNKNAFNKSNKTLRENIKSLEGLIKKEVIRGKETVTFGNIRAEYIPSVVIKIRKEEKEDGNN